MGTLQNTLWLFISAFLLVQEAKGRVERLVQTHVVDPVILTGYGPMTYKPVAHNPFQGYFSPEVFPVDVNEKSESSNKVTWPSETFDVPVYSVYRTVETPITVNQAMSQRNPTLKRMEAQASDYKKMDLYDNFAGKVMIQKPERDVELPIDPRHVDINMFHHPTEVVRQRRYVAITPGITSRKYDTYMVYQQQKNFPGPTGWYYGNKFWY